MEHASKHEMCFSTVNEILDILNIWYKTGDQNKSCKINQAMIS